MGFTRAWPLIPATPYTQGYRVDSMAGADDDDKIEGALALAVAAGQGEILFSGRVYTVNDPHTVSGDDITLRGEPGATIQIGDSPTGVLSTNGRVFTLGARINVKFRDLTFLGPAAGTLSVSATASAFIYISSSAAAYNEITDCVFDINGHMNANQMAVINAQADYTKILRNRCTGCGIVYSQNEASFAVCADNTVVDAGTNGLSGTGDGTNYNVSCVVRNNVVISPNRMGIEDFTKTLYTQIVGNYVENPGVTSNSMGISAVGFASLVQGNTILDHELYGIEAGGRSMRIIDNIIRNSSYVTSTQGISVNGGDLDIDAIGGAVIEGNVIENNTTGISVINASGPVSVVGNQVLDCVIGIQSDTTTHPAIVSVADNMVRWTIASQAAGRVGIRLQPSSFNNLGSRVIGNSIYWDTTAGGGPHTANEEISIYIDGDNVMCAFNLVNANSCVDASAHACGRVYGFGDKTVFFGNQLFGGATLDFASLTNSQAHMNNLGLNTGGTTNNRLGMFGKSTTGLLASAYTVTNSTPDRAYDANTVAVGELAQVVAALIADLKTYGLLI